MPAWPAGGVSEFPSPIHVEVIAEPVSNKKRGEEGRKEVRLDSYLRRRLVLFSVNTHLDLWRNAPFFDTPPRAFQAFSLLSMQILNPPDGGLIRRDC